jgi:DNA-binding Lrp family transcriptional regulator
MSRRKQEFTERNVSVIRFENSKVPEIKEVRGKDWIQYGEKNDYPEYLLKLFNRSAKHNAIVTGKVHYIVGNGFAWDKNVAIDQFIDKINPNYSIDDLLHKTTTDLEIFNGFYLQALPDSKGRLSEIHHIDFSKMRIHKDKDKFLYSNDWTKHRQSAEETGLKVLYPFDKAKNSGVVFFKQYRPGTNIYPVPDYIGCIPYIEADYEIANFHLNNIQNGFVGGTMISFNNGVPTREEQIIVEQKIKNKFTGTDKAGQLVISFAESKDNASTVTPLTPNNFDKLFEGLNLTVQQEIFTGHKVTSPMLFGVKEAGQLGGRNELRESFELFQNGYIKSKQTILADVYNDLFEAAGKGRPLSIIPTEPISAGISEDAILKVMTEDEIRQKAGLPVIEKPIATKDQVVLNALNSLSPLVATKVLETMTPDEIRGLAALPAKGPSQVAVMKAQFKSDNNIESVFSKFGRPKKEYQILKNSEVENKDQVMLGEIAFYRQQFKTPEPIDSLSRSILDLISKDGLIESETIAKILKKPAKDIAVKIQELQDKGLVKGEVGKSLEVQPEGQSILNDDPAATEKIEVLYSYEVRKGVGPEIIPTTREFCKHLIELDKLYTREEIETISEIVGRDVWRDRGGYYHDPKTDQTTPFCRHVWNQNIVRKK